MDILSLPVSLDQFLVARHMGQHPQLDLRIVRVQENKSIFRHKHFADQSSQFHPHRDILKIGLCAADPSCSGDRLIKGGMDPAVFFDHCAQAVRVSGFQLCKLPVFQDIFYDRLFRGQLFQNVGRCGIPRFCFFPAGDPHFFKKDGSQLFRGINIELLARLFPDQFFQLMDPDA